MNTSAITYGILGPYTPSQGFRVDGAKVRHWATRKQAEAAARALKWPLKAVTKVSTRFQVGYALIDTRFGGLSPESFGKLWANMGLSLDDYETLIEAA